MVSSQESLVWDSGDSFFTLLFLNAMYLVFATNCIIIGTVNTENELFDAQLYTVTKLTSLFLGTNLWFFCWFLFCFYQVDSIEDDIPPHFMCLKVTWQLHKGFI